MIVTFINQYTNKLYHYTTLAWPNFFWKKGRILFYWSGITTTLKFDSGILEPRYGVLITCYSRVMTEFLMWLFPYNYILSHKTEDDPLYIQYDGLIKLSSFVFQNNRRRVNLASCVTFKTLRKWNHKFFYPDQHLVCEGPHNDVCISAETFWCLRAAGDLTFRNCRKTQYFNY